MSKWVTYANPSSLVAHDARRYSQRSITRVMLSAMSLTFRALWSKSFAWMYTGTTSLRLYF